jgi:hypothetical protein
MATNTRELLKEKIDAMTDDQVDSMLTHAAKITTRFTFPLSDTDRKRWIEMMESDELSEDYSFENDPSIGFISADEDLSERVEDILYGENSDDANPTKRNST